MGKRINKENQSNMLHMRRERILLCGWVIGSGRLEGRWWYYIASKSSFDYSFTQGHVWKELNPQLFYCENLEAPREEIVFLKWRSLNNLSWCKNPSPSWRKKLVHTLTLIDMTPCVTCTHVHEKGQLNYSSRKHRLKHCAVCGSCKVHSVIGTQSNLT